MFWQPVMAGYSDGVLSAAQESGRIAGNCLILATIVLVNPFNFQCILAGGAELREISCFILLTDQRCFVASVQHDVPIDKGL